MAKTPKKPAAKPGAKSADARRPKPPTAKRPSKVDAKARLAAEHEEFYQANKKRIDEALGHCIKHFKNDEPEIVRAVGRMLFSHYIDNRMKTPKGRPPGQSAG